MHINTKLSDFKLRFAGTKDAGLILIPRNLMDKSCRGE